MNIYIYTYIYKWKVAKCTRGIMNPPWGIMNPPGGIMNPPGVFFLIGPPPGDGERLESEPWGEPTAEISVDAEDGRLRLGLGVFEAVTVIGEPRPDCSVLALGDPVEQ